jgi:hypothetical protein
MRSPNRSRPRTLRPWRECRAVRHAADGPDVDGGGVVGGVEQQLGRAVPPCDHVLRHHVALRRRPRQPEVADLQIAVSVQQQVAGLRGGSPSPSGCT